jgi:hypothetical protein
MNLLVQGRTLKTTFLLLFNGKNKSIDWIQYSATFLKISRWNFWPSALFLEWGDNNATGSITLIVVNNACLLSGMLKADRGESRGWKSKRLYIYELSYTDEHTKKQFSFVWEGISVTIYTLCVRTRGIRSVCVCSRSTTTTRPPLTVEESNRKLSLIIAGA